MRNRSGEGLLNMWPAVNVDICRILIEVKAFVASYLQGKGIMPQKKLAGQDLK
jgi:hypothetical protein